jgi:hypothetical protein
MQLRKSKKAASLDNIWAAVIFFGLAIFFLALMLCWQVLRDQATILWTGSSIGNDIRINMDNAVNQFDWILVMFWIAIHLGILITAYLLRTHPVIYVIAIIITALIALLAAPLSNAWNDLSDDGELISAAAEYPKADFILDNLPKFEIIWCFITIIVMFGLAKTQGFI